MDNYEVEILGAKIKVSVVKDYTVVGSKINELKSLLQTLQNRVVGVDVKIDNPAVSSNDPFVVHLILCVGTHCLIIRLCRFRSVIVLDPLKLFLADDTICFVCNGIKLNNTLNRVLLDDFHLRCSTGVELDYLAFKIMEKISKIKKYGFAEFSYDVKMYKIEQIDELLDWNAKVFSQKQIKYAVHNAYSIYAIVKKLLDMML